MVDNTGGSAGPEHGTLACAWTLVEFVQICVVCWAILQELTLLLLLALEASCLGWGLKWLGLVRRPFFVWVVRSVRSASGFCGTPYSLSLGSIRSGLAGEEDAVSQIAT